MKMLKLLFSLLIIIAPFFAISQSKISVGAGLISSQVEGKIILNRLGISSPKKGYKHTHPFIGFSYESHPDEHFFISGNANYTNFKIPFYNSRTDVEINSLKYNHISTSLLFNFELYEHKKNEEQIWSLFFGVGVNVNHFRNFRISSESILVDRELGKEANRRELGMIYNVALEYKNFKIAFNHAIGQKLYEGMSENYIESSDWYSISTSYVFILND